MLLRETTLDVEIVETYGRGLRARSNNHAHFPSTPAMTVHISTYQSLLQTIGRISKSTDGSINQKMTVIATADLSIAD